MELGLNKSVTIPLGYLRNLRLQLSVGKTVSTAYPLNDIEAKRELNVFVNNMRLVFHQAPLYLGGCWTSSNTLKKWLARSHLESHSSVVLLVQPGENVRDLHTNPGILCSWMYCAQVWSRCSHVKKVDVTTNSSIRTISDCLNPTPVSQLHVLTFAHLCSPLPIISLAGEIFFPEEFRPSHYLVW